MKFECINGASASADDRRRLHEDDNYVLIGITASRYFAYSVFLGMHNGITNIFFGLSLDRTVFFHKYIGRLAIFLGWLHGILMVNNSDEGKWFKGHGRSGTIAMIFATILLGNN